jgi:hypothetical protein
MKFKREIINGFIIFIGIGAFFLLMEALKLSHVFYLRLFNIIFVIYGVNRTIKGNIAAGVRGYNTNFMAALITSMVGAALSIAGLLIYVKANGGAEYLLSRPQRYIFGGNTMSVEYFCIALFFEAAAASLAVSFCLMQFYKDKVEVINKVD